MCPAGCGAPSVLLPAPVWRNCLAAACAVSRSVILYLLLNCWLKPWDVQSCGQLGGRLQRLWLVANVFVSSFGRHLPH